MIYTQIPSFQKDECTYMKLLTLKNLSNICPQSKIQKYLAMKVSKLTSFHLQKLTKPLSYFPCIEISEENDLKEPC